MQRLPRPLRVKDYQPLADYLARQSAATVTLTFAEIETILGQRLPPSARTRAWWMHGVPRRGYRRLLTPLGWMVGAVHRRRAVEAVTFMKADARGEEQP